MNTGEDQNRHDIIHIGERGLVRPSSGLIQRGLELAKRAKPRRKILVVEDDEWLLDMLVYFFRCRGYDSLSALNGQEGLNIFSVEAPDIVVSNIYMPHLNGLQLLRCLRKASPATPVVLTSGFRNLHKIAAVIRKADAFFEKPFRLEPMAACVEGFLAEPNMRSIESAETSSPQLPKKVLVVDCSDDFLGKIFRGFGYRTFTAENGQDGFDLFHATWPDVVVTQPVSRIDEDRILWTAIKDVSPETAIILISGFGPFKEDLKKHPKFRGPIMFVEVPCPLEVLKTAIERLLGLNVVG